MSAKPTLFHAPNTRSTGALTLLYELGADFDLHVLNFKASEQRAPAYLAVNPMGKVPAVMHDGERFTAADVLWGTALTWTTAFKLVPLSPVIQSYVERWNARPSAARAKATDAELASAFAATQG